MTIGGGTIQNVEALAELWGSNFDDQLTIEGAPGVSTVRAGDGDDWIISQGGYAQLFGDGGNDRVDVYGGNAGAYGGDGNDAIHVYGGAVSAEGGAGDDSFYGG